ncbi:Neurofilament medium polypeptide [Balamuthia mandrillaris]
MSSGGSGEQSQKGLGAEEAAALVADKACFREATLHLRLHLPPRFLADVKKGVDLELNEHLMRYVEDLNGVVLAYWNVGMVEDHATILYERPHLHFTVKAETLLFSPEIGMTLVGTVNKVGSDHFGLLVLGIFNASISASHIPASYVRDSEEEVWRNKDDPQSTIAVGQRVRFRVHRLNIAGNNMMAIVGSLMGENLGPTQGSIDERLIEALLKQKAKEEEEKEEEAEKQKEKEESTENEQEASSSSEVAAQPPPEGKKKKRKREDKTEPSTTAAKDGADLSTVETKQEEAKSKGKKSKKQKDKKGEPGQENATPVTKKKRRTKS